MSLSFCLLLAACVASLATEGSTDYVSAYGIFRNKDSGKYVHYIGSNDCPWDDWTLVLRTGHADATRLKFVQVIGHYGYLEHSCGKAVHPYQGEYWDSTLLVFHHSRYSAALWTVDQESMMIYHHSGKHVRSESWVTHPPEGTLLILHSQYDYTARYEFVDPSNLQVIPIFPDPDLLGIWRIIYAVIDPLGDHEFTLSYKVGKSISKQASEEFEWTVSSSLAFAWFENSLEYRESAQRTETATWEVETARTINIKVPAGQTVVTWQYFFEAEQFGDGFQFSSTILGDTDNVNTPPELSRVLAKYESRNPE